MPICNPAARFVQRDGPRAGEASVRLRGPGIAAALALAAASAAAAPDARTAAAPQPDPVGEFLARHWVDPLPPQGAPPAKFSPLEASLDPESCGACHVQQLRDWKTSLHSRTMGPGLMWQFLLMGQDAANECMRCHAPLAEQKALMARERGWQNAPAAPPPSYVPPQLHHEGLVCAACHVRRHARFGPPARAASKGLGQAGLPHGGFTAEPAFEDSRFCATCHQFPPNGAKLDGKLLENTYVEWRASPAARQGKACQSCHMPDRRHLWRGIHDPDMVRRALQVSLQVRRDGGYVRARADLANVGAGHYFPTYLVPKVTATLELVDADGTVRSQLARRVIGREADLKLAHEISDTRLAPGARMSMEARFRGAPAQARGSYVRLRVVVDPGEHYERLFRSLLERPEKLPAGALPLLREALARLESGHYELYKLTRPLPAS